MTQATRSNIQIAMNGDLSVYRIRIWTADKDIFRQALGNVCHKIKRIAQGPIIQGYDIILNESDVLQLKLSVSTISFEWIQDWIDVKL